MAAHRRGRGSLLYLPDEQRRVQDAFRDWNSDPDIVVAANGHLTIQICEGVFELEGTLTPLDLAVFDGNGSLFFAETPPLAPVSIWIAHLFEPLREFAHSMK